MREVVIYLEKGLKVKAEMRRKGRIVSPQGFAKSHLISPAEKSWRAKTEKGND